MALVFLARDEALGRDVVIKILMPELAVTLNVERFTREIKLVARLQQANIVPVLSAGTAGALPFYSMPFIEGLNLRQRMEKDSPSLHEAVRILGDVARALEFAHAHGVVHRDIKPENVLLSGGTAVVTDFGIAKALNAAKTIPTLTLTARGRPLGTPCYMTPEQAAGDDVDERSDSSAGGVIAYELLPGSHPFPARTPARQHQRKSPGRIFFRRHDRRAGARSVSLATAARRFAHFVIRVQRQARAGPTDRACVERRRIGRRHGSARGEPAARYGAAHRRQHRTRCLDGWLRASRRQRVPGPGRADESDRDRARAQATW